MQVSTIGLDLAKNVFQVHGIDAKEKVVVRKQLRRSQVIAFFEALPPCLVGLEACGGSHYWAREITKLGHTVKLMAPQAVKPYVQDNKTDGRDAEGTRGAETLGACTSGALGVETLGTRTSGVLTLGAFTVGVFNSGTLTLGTSTGGVTGVWGT